jgi:hypothetical protein
MTIPPKASLKILGRLHHRAELRVAHQPVAVAVGPAHHRAELLAAQPEAELAHLGRRDLVRHEHDLGRRDLVRHEHAVALDAGLLEKLPGVKAVGWPVSPRLVSADLARRSPRLR